LAEEDPTDKKKKRAASEVKKVQEAYLGAVKLLIAEDEVKLEITNDFRSKTFMEKIGFRNKRKEQKIFDLGTDKLHKCREELQKIVKESYTHQAV